MTRDWIKRLADDERRRDAIRAGEAEASARKTALVRRHGQALLDELRATVVLDLEAFTLEFPDDDDRAMVMGSDGESGFLVRRPGQTTVSLNVSPRWDAAAVACRYRFPSPGGLPAREDRFELVLVPHGDDAAHFKHLGSGVVFADAGVLSEYLLTPVLTGRPR